MKPIVMFQLLGVAMLLALLVYICLAAFMTFIFMLVHIHVLAALAIAVSFFILSALIIATLTGKLEKMGEYLIALFRPEAKITTDIPGVLEQLPSEQSEVSIIQTDGEQDADHVDEIESLTNRIQELEDYSSRCNVYCIQMQEDYFDLIRKHGELFLEHSKLEDEFDKLTAKEKRATSRVENLQNELNVLRKRRNICGGSFDDSKSAPGRDNLNAQINSPNKPKDLLVDKPNTNNGSSAAVSSQSDQSLNDDNSSQNMGNSCFEIITELGFSTLTNLYGGIKNDVIPFPRDQKGSSHFDDVIQFPGYS